MTVTPGPAPCSVRILLVIVTPHALFVVVQVQLPAGTVTMSPSEAPFMAVCTSEPEQLAALIVPAHADDARRTKVRSTADRIAPHRPVPERDPRIIVKRYLKELINL